MFDSFFVQIFVKGIAGEIFEQSCKMIFAESCKICGVIERHVLGAVFLYVLTYINELCGVFFLLGVCYFALDSLT